MAALLKKRALAEYTQVIQEEPIKPAKKLRLTSKKTKAVSTLEFDLQGTSNAQEILQILLRLSESLPVDVEDVDNLVRKLLEHICREKETFVRVKIISLLGQLAKTSGFEASLLVEDVISLLKSETSHKVVAQIIHTLILIGLACPEGTKLHQRLTALAKQHLTHPNYLVKCQCLHLISVMDHQPELSQKLLADFCRDQDARVRGAALDSLLKLHNCGFQLDVSLYEQVSKSLSDDYEGVRLASVKLVWTFSQLYSESIITSSETQQELRLIDDGFAKICNMLNDLSMKVRSEAATLLGSMVKVSLHFLEQTVDKKLMSNMRKKGSAHDRLKENYKSGEWSTGAKWADDKPREEIDADSISLISTGACGAFVHGLEDEFLEVRLASVESLCDLTIHTPSFAVHSLDFLVDMVNDEIEEVRLKAINSLCKISQHIIFREDQLESMLAVLEDFSMDIREALREMLSCGRLSTKACLKATYDALVDNMRRYPQDRVSIWRCLQQLGRNHPSFVLSLVSSFLNMHPYFDMPEPNTDDPFYIGSLIIVFNAAHKSPTMLPLFQEHTLRHYEYMRDTLPSLVPQLKLPGQPEPIEREQLSRSGGSDYLQNILRTLQQENVQPEFLELTIRDLERMSEIEPNFSATAQCLAFYVRGHLLLSKALVALQQQTSIVRLLHSGSRGNKTAEQVLSLTSRLEHLFVGLSPKDQSVIKQLQLRAMALQAIQLVRQGSPALTWCENFLDKIDELQRFLLSHSIPPDNFFTALFEEMDRLDSIKPSSITQTIFPLLQQHSIPQLELTNPIQRAQATINEPTGQSDSALKFTAGLILGVNLDAQLENIENINSIKIRVKYPDQQVQLILPKLSDFRETRPFHYRLMTEVYLSHSVWSEACHVDLSIVMCYKAFDYPKTEDDVIPLCKPVQVYIAPKPVRKS